MELSPSQSSRAKQLFNAALACSPVSRGAFLRHNEQDELVREEVRRLLAEHTEQPTSVSPAPAENNKSLEAETGRRLRSGELLAGRFRIAGFLAAGGMGEVYQAEDLHLDRTVALKFLSMQVAQDRLSLDRLRSEAKAASRLNHPNICTVYDFWEDEGRAFIAMELLEGETLSARLRRGPLSAREVIGIALPMANALAIAHRKGIVHRDLKPGNVMLTENGIKLLDFGLAKRKGPTISETETASVLTNVGQIAGTLPYMSPEQLKGEEVDARCDIFAFGAVLYEMLSGHRAFERKSSSETISAVIEGEPRPLKEIAKDVPPVLEEVVGRCLRKEAEQRYGSMAEIERALEGCRENLVAPAPGGSLAFLLRQGWRPRVAIAAFVVLVIVVGAGAWWIRRTRNVNWARERALPEIGRLVEAEKFVEAYALGLQAERYIPNDPVLAKYWDRMSYRDSIKTIPPGVTVFRKNYAARDDQWELVGISPIEERRFPWVDSRWRFERKGFATVERATFVPYVPEGNTVVLSEEGKAPEGMVPVTIQDPGSADPAQVSLYGLPGFEYNVPLPLQDYWIDKYEVTNREFKVFVDRGGYANSEYWIQEFRKDGRVLPRAEAMKLFLDTTGRPGPATWVQSDYPQGEDDFPVTGVSWYEAAAYAKFVGKSLPTMHHWKAAAATAASASIVPVSNFSRQGPAKVGSYLGVGRFGTYDMAGNVKEWIWNEDRSGRRYVLGGAWNEPGHMFFNADARSPFERLPTFGFRCARYNLSGEYAKVADPIERNVRDYQAEKPVSDEVFRAYKSLYSYDKTPLHARIESTKQTSNWKLERITYDAAYGHERIIAQLYLPLNASPPFQVVVYFPGAVALGATSSDDQPQLEEFEFFIKSGRAVLFPVYKSTYERSDDYRAGQRKDTSTYRDHVIEWSKDLGRSIDYLETRPDIDARKIAYEGASWGAAMGALLPAVEPRLKALVLDCPGFIMQKPFPEADQLNFAPRVTAPVLMLNGRYDFVFPPEASQEPMFRLLGTPPEHKRRVLFDSGHDTPHIAMVRESLDWLDRYLGPVH